MSRGLNKVLLIGNIGNKGDLVKSKSGLSIINITLATNNVSKDKETGKNVLVPEWHNVTLFDKLAEILDQYTKKGSKIYIEGYLKTDEYVTKEGHKAKSTKIIATTLNILDGKQDQEHQETITVKVGGKSPSLDNKFDDDLPF